MRLRRHGLAIAIFVGVVSAPTAASAVPSYSRQTGEPCTSCHVGAYGPQLTPHGRAFKLAGYSEGKTVVPLSGAAEVSFTHTAKDQPQPVSGHDGRNDNIALQEVGGFIAGRILPHLGTFIAVEFSEIERHTMLDHFDVRYGQPLTIGGKDAILGFSVNNTPGSTDPFQSYSEMSFPHVRSELVAGQQGLPLLSEGIEGQVAGLNSYLWFDDSFYAEIGGYRSLSHGLLRTIGVEDVAGKIRGVAPYGRLAYQKDWGRQAASIGLIGFHAAIHPEREPGPTNKFTDWGLDATYQYLGNRKNILAASLAYVHERQKRDFDVEQGVTGRRRHSLNSLKGSVSYFLKNTYGVTGALFTTWGTRDRELLQVEEGGGSRTGRPNTSGFILEADWVPFGKEKSWGAPYANLKVGIQYTGYFKFNGASSNYDGFGRDASDNNILFGFVSVVF